MLDAEALHARLKDYGYASMMQGSSMIQGGALAMAAVSLLPLLGRTLDPVALLMWLAGVVGISAIYVAYIRAAIMEPEDGRFGQMSLMAIGICEMLQFASLSAGWPHQRTYAAWLLVSAVGGGVLIWEAVNRTRRLARGPYAEELAELVDLTRRSGWRRVRAMAAITAILAATGAATALGVASPRALSWIAAAPAALYGLLTLGVHVQVHFERLAVSRIVAAALQAQSRGP